MSPRASPDACGPPSNAGAQELSGPEADFPLPTLGPKLREIRDEVVLGKGFHLIK